MPQKNYLPGGLIMCVGSVVFYYRIHDGLDLPWLIFSSLLFVCGIWAVLSSLFKLDADGVLSWIVGAVVALGFATFAFLFAWRETDGWSCGIPFVPAAWNNAVARILFALGGLLALLSTAVFLSKARKKFRKGSDDAA